MSSQQFATTVDSPPKVIIEFPGRRSVARYECKLSTMKVRLQEAFAQVEALLRQRNGSMPGQEISCEPSASRETAAMRIAGLTPRQREIMELVLAGHPSKNIGADLHISIRTVESHRARIKQRTGRKIASCAGPTRGRRWLASLLDSFLSPHVRRGAEMFEATRAPSVER
jgi:DNA-binding CsgD family transcriptional regulator